MNIKLDNNNYLKKIRNFIFEFEKNKDNPFILEFGVRQGRSTKMFLEICERNNGSLISIDIDDYANLFNDKNWTFIQCRDDNKVKISPFLKKNVDIILIDSFHDPYHVLKIINLYWENLTIGGSMYIDDISWLPYIKNSWRDHKYSENINFDTFQMLLNLLNSNKDNFTLEFNFQDSGMARLIKLKDNILEKPKKIIRRKNLIKIILNKLRG